MFAEMQSFSEADPEIAPDMILRMATTNPAQALGRKGELGALSPGAAADLIAIPFGGAIGSVYDAVLKHRGAVRASMIDGQWVVAPPE